MRLEAAGPGLDPVLGDGARLAAVQLRLPGAEGRTEAGGDALERDPSPGRGDPRALYAGRGRHADLERLAVGAEGGAQAAGAEESECGGALLLLRLEGEEGGRGHGRADRSAHRGRVPAALVQSGVGGVGQGAHRLEAGAVRGEHVADATAKI